MATKEATEGKKATAKKEEGPKMITTRDIANDLGTKPATLRRYLRSLPQFQDSGYTRYKFDPEKDAKKIANIKEGFAKFKTEESEKNKKRLADLKEKGKGKKTASKKSADEDGGDDEGGDDEELE